MLCAFRPSEIPYPCADFSYRLILYFEMLTLPTFHSNFTALPTSAQNQSGAFVPRPNLQTMHPVSAFTQFWCLQSLHRTISSVVLLFHASSASWSDICWHVLQHPFEHLTTQCATRPGTINSCASLPQNGHCFKSLTPLHRPSCRLWHSIQSLIPSGKQSSQSVFHFMSYGIVGCASICFSIQTGKNFDWSLSQALTSVLIKASASINLNPLHRPSYYLFPTHWTIFQWISTTSETIICCPSAVPIRA